MSVSYTKNRTTAGWIVRIMKDGDVHRKFIADRDKSRRAEAEVIEREMAESLGVDLSKLRRTNVGQEFQTEIEEGIVHVRRPDSHDVVRLTWRTADGRWRNTLLSVRVRPLDKVIEIARKKRRQRHVEHVA